MRWMGSFDEYEALLVTLYTYIHTYIYRSAHFSLRILSIMGILSMCIHVHTYTHTYTHTYHIHTALLIVSIMGSVPNVHTHTHTHTYTHRSAPVVCASCQSWATYLMYIHTHKHTHIHTIYIHTALRIVSIMGNVPNVHTHT
jgi:hypothetical protein